MAREPKLNRKGDVWRTNATLSSLALGTGLFVSPAAEAELIIMNLGISVADGETRGVDAFTTSGLGGPDGVDDFQVTIGNDPTAPFTKVEPLGFSGSSGSFAGPCDDGTPRPCYDFFVNNTAGTVAERFASGDAIGPATLDKPLRSALIGDPFWEVGDTGYLGIQITVDDTTTRYGWLEITLGSLEITRVGVESEPGVAASVPASVPVPVPEPSGLSLLAAGAAGLLAFRRRRQANVEPS